MFYLKYRQCEPGICWWNLLEFKAILSNQGLSLKSIRMNPRCSAWAGLINCTQLSMVANTTNSYPSGGETASLDDHKFILPGCANRSRGCKMHIISLLLWSGHVSLSWNAMLYSSSFSKKVWSSEGGCKLGQWELLEVKGNVICEERLK